MITLFAIILIGFAIYKAFNPTPDKKGSQEEIEEAITKLPPLHLKGKPVSGIEKICFGKGYCIDVFDYRDGNLTVSLQNGKRFSGKLMDYSFCFSNVKGLIEITLGIGGKNTTFNYVESIFTKDEWNAICGVMLCAGKTYGADVIKNQFGSMAKVKTAAEVGKLIYKLSQL